MSDGFTSEWLQARMLKNAAALRASQPPIDSVEREADLHNAIWAECRRRRWIALHGAMSESTSRTLGEPDFVIMADRGRVFFIECKSRKGKLSTHQQAFRTAAMVNGHAVHTVRSMKEFLSIIDTTPQPLNPPNVKTNEISSRLVDNPTEEKI